MKKSCINGTTILLLVFFAVIVQSQSVEEWRKKAEAAVIGGEYKNAITYYTKLIELEPKKPSHYYKRATVQLRLRNFQKVIPDLNQVLKLDPTFVEGYVHRGKVNAMRGDCELAKDDYEKVLKIKPQHEFASKQLPLMDSCITNIKLAEEAFKRNDFPSALGYADAAQQTAYESIKLFVLKAKCFMHRNDYQEVLAETRKILTSESNNIEALSLRGDAYYKLGEHDVALTHYREGLKFDPEHKAIKSQFKKLRSLMKSASSGDDSMTRGEFKEAVNSYLESINVDPHHLLHQTSLFLKLCKAYIKLKDGENAVSSCTNAIQRDQNLLEAWLSRGEAHLLLKNYQEAINDYQKAQQMSNNDQRAMEGLRNAQLEQKKSLRKDYYKVLGVTQDASQRVIKKHFHKLALDNHPDKHPDEREKYEKIFREIGEAYEVLSNEETRGKYDRGEDIQMDPNAGMNHFHQFFQQGQQQQFFFRFGG